MYFLSFANVRAVALPPLASDASFMMKKLKNECTHTYIYSYC